MFNARKKVRSALARVGLVVAAATAIPVAMAAPASAGETTGTPTASPAAPSDVMRPMGGCVIGVCGTVYNSTGTGFYVTMNWCCTDNRWLNGGQTTAGWGDVDGIQVPDGCGMKVSIETFPQGSYRDEFWTSGWHRIHTNEYAIVQRVPCGG